jgi:TIR domain
MPPVRQFCSYSHKDRALADDLDEHFGILRKVGMVEHWFSHEIGPGDEWRGRIEQRLESADVILLLVSPSFINSDYCYDVELKRAMERHRSREARVIPVILRPCMWPIAPFGKLQALPEGGKPITMWGNQDEAFTHVVQAVYDLAKSLHPPHDGAGV